MQVLGRRENQMRPGVRCRLNQRMISSVTCTYILPIFRAQDREYVCESCIDQSNGIHISHFQYFNMLNTEVSKAIMKKQIIYYDMFHFHSYHYYLCVKSTSVQSEKILLSSFVGIVSMIIYSLRYICSQSQQV